MGQKEGSMITQEELKQLVHYNPETGAFYRYENAGRGRGKSGGLVGVNASTSDGYTEVRLSGRKYRGHRLAWLYMKGGWPSQQIDHIDGNRSNNAFKNLRLVTNAQNTQNVVRARSRSKSGLLGVTKARDKWAAKIMANGRLMHLGTYETKEEAHAAYLAKKKAVHIEVTRAS
jgi:hypothetical protein